ncbi:protease complex subunit PrcB family protein [Aneurinibacillus tyrosinisolvens]|uniref:protease complex subunit PrcB family protein n=1 Tax=Aneurinibacillus tyrosinisolvens TaxID=1443435 RepID=UPI000699E06D|nr:protease complex subunit PrcB family protein [Aneurinibacillus tyrosinisolvens]
MNKKTWKTLIISLITVLVCGSGISYAYTSFTQKGSVAAMPDASTGQGKPVPFETIAPLQFKDKANLPEKVKQWYDTHRQTEFKGVMQDGSESYVLISRGQSPNLGYRVEPVNVTETDKEVIVTVKYINPEPDKMYAQAITYPSVIVKVSDVQKPIHINIVK